jgi:hypothetical protein
VVPLLADVAADAIVVLFHLQKPSEEAQGGSCSEWRPGRTLTSSPQVPQGKSAIGALSYAIQAPTLARGNREGKKGACGGFSLLLKRHPVRGRWTGKPPSAFSEDFLKLQDFRKMPLWFPKRISGKGPVFSGIVSASP